MKVIDIEEIKISLPSANNRSGPIPSNRRSISAQQGAWGRWPDYGGEYAHKEEIQSMQTDMS
jgi:hypothetical protein